MLMTIEVLVKLMRGAVIRLVKYGHLFIYNSVQLYKLWQTMCSFKGIWTRVRTMVGAVESFGLWRPPSLAGELIDKLN